MNTEQLRAEFEAWAATIKLENGKQILLKTPAYNAAALLGYQAAAQSRDELIGKLVKALKLYGSTSYHSGERDEDGYTEAMIEDMEPNPELGTGLWSGKTAREALAEARAQGYGE